MSAHDVPFEPFRGFKLILFLASGACILLSMLMSFAMGFNGNDYDTGFDAALILMQACYVLLGISPLFGIPDKAAPKVAILITAGLGIAGFAFNQVGQSLGTQVVGSASLYSTLVGVFFVASPALTVVALSGAWRFPAKQACPEEGQG